MANLKDIQSNNGGQYNASKAAGTTASGTILTGAGRLCKVTVLTVGSGATPFYDGTDSSGSMIFQLPANPTVGQIFDVQMPVVTGLYLLGITTISHGLALSYNKDGSNGN